MTVSDSTKAFRRIRSANVEAKELKPSIEVRDADKRPETSGSVLALYSCIPLDHVVRTSILF